MGHVTEARDHCPRCSSTKLWDVDRSDGRTVAYKCQECGFIFSLSEVVRGVDLDL